MSSANAMGAILGPLVSMLTLPLSILYIPAIMGGLWVIGMYLVLFKFIVAYIDSLIFVTYFMASNVYSS